MKKAFSISFVLFYLLLSVGFTINVRHCKKSRTICKAEKSEKGHCCSDKGEKSCCDHESYFLHLDFEDQLWTNQRDWSQKDVLVGDIVLTEITDDETIDIPTQIVIQDQNVPPDPLFAVHCSRLHYG